MGITIDGLDIFHGDESAASTEARLNVTAPPGYEPGDALIVGLKSTGSKTIGGLASGIHAMGLSGYPNDPEDALAQWLLEFESLCQAEQGGGWTVVDDERDRSVNAIVTSLSWTRNQGAPYTVRWTLTAQKGEGVMSSSARNPETATPQSSHSLGGQDLGGFVEKRTELSLDTEIIPIAFADESDTVVVPNSGVVRRINLSGRFGGSQTHLRNADDTLEGYVGTNTAQTYQTGFPGTSHETRVETYDSTYSGGSPSILDYNLTLFEGLTI